MSAAGGGKARRGGNFDAARSAPRKRFRPGSRGDVENARAGDRPGLGSRLVAAKLLSAIVDARISADGLMDPGHGHPGFRALEPRDQALVRAIILTALRFRGTIGARIAACLDRPLPPNALALRHILHVGAAQILYLDVPDSAAVDLAVAACSADPRSRRFAGMVNAVLRRIAREKGGDAAESVSPTPELGAQNCPPWLFERLTVAYGEAEARTIAAMHLTPAPLDLSVKGDPARWAERLGGLVLPTGTVRLGQFDGPVAALPGFADGQWWVQDAAAALPARLFGPIEGRRIADLCAAPGGKTAQLAAAGAKVTALDLSASRMRRLAENLARLKLCAETHVGDLAAFEPEALFDGVLFDAPCSSTGTIRRHPDVAYTKDAAEIGKLAAVQARLLDAAARLVRPGGLLVFSNCSLDPVEGEAVVEAFLARNRQFSRRPVGAEEVPGLGQAVTPDGDLRTTPAMLPNSDPRLAGLDGFFAARLMRGEIA